MKLFVSLSTASILLFRNVMPARPYRVAWKEYREAERKKRTDDHVHSTFPPVSYEAYSRDGSKERVVAECR